MDSSAFSLSWIGHLSGGKKTVTNAGTAECLVSSTKPCAGVIIQALRTNTGFIFIGGTDVLGTAGSENGISITPAQTIMIPANNLNVIYLDATVSGEGVTYIRMK